MKLNQFIQTEIFTPRLAQSGVLVVYDPARRYRQICLDMSTDQCTVIDATESSIESRESALATLQLLGELGASVKSMVIYVPAAAPLTDEDRQRDPFSIHGAVGEVFPSGDGDEFQSICLKAKSDYATQIRQVFRENPSPSFEVIDAIGGGGGWPQLQAALDAESARDLLFHLLAPSDEKKKGLKENDAWVAEAKQLLASSLGLKLITRGKSWNAIGDELWRFVLYSEFVFDLPVELPEALADVPRAAEEARPVIEDLCERLRNDRRTQSVYIERAEQVEADLQLPTICTEIKDLGKRDTFAFEERSFFALAVDAMQRDAVDQVREILDRHSYSVWIGKGESQAQWQLLRSALSLIEACDDADRQLPDHCKDQQSLIDFYIASLREVDRLQREFEQSAPDWLLSTDVMQEIVDAAQKAYQQLIERVQAMYTKHLETSGWPAAGMLSNADSFDTLVAPKLKESGRRVAYVLVDALRYELGVALEKQLRDEGQVEMQAACAQLPSVTPVGMASLLPGAGGDLRIDMQGNDYVVMLGDVKLKTVTNRIAVLKDRYGARFAEVKLNDLIKPRYKIDKSVELLAVRTNDLDERFESSLEAGLSDVATQLKRLRVAVHKLRELGFDDAVIVTDHGFFINAHAGPGDVGNKPPGNWVNFHDRSLIGKGSSDVRNFAVPSQHVGIRGDFGRFAGPKGMVAYSAGVSYFHGGASLQECIVPVISVRLCEAVVKLSAVKRIRLVTSYDNQEQLTDVQQKFEEIKQSLLERDVKFDVKLNPNMHDREIRIDNGWVIKIGRGLHFFQKPNSWFDIGVNDLTLRKCLETKVDIFKAK
jgi:hypothetical protein